jgi:hypothetical protein
MLYRGDRTFMKKYIGDPRICRRIEDQAWKNNPELKSAPFRGFPENLRLVPANKRWDESTLQKKIVLLRLHWPRIVSVIEGGVDTWVQVTQALLKKGI